MDGKFCRKKGRKEREKWEEVEDAQRTPIRPTEGRPPTAASVRPSVARSLVRPSLDSRCIRPSRIRRGLGPFAYDGREICDLRTTSPPCHSPTQATCQYYRLLLSQPPSPCQCGRHMWLPSVGKGVRACETRSSRVPNLCLSLHCSY